MEKQEIITAIKRYIANTGGLPSGYDLRIAEVRAIAGKGRVEDVVLAFRYGQAKGYRAAKAGARAQKQDKGLPKHGRAKLE